LNTQFNIKADLYYPMIFHSPGLEPWILGLLQESKPKSMLEVGCGYGFWGFIAKMRINSINYTVGLDLDFEKVSKAKAIFDDVLLADARFPPIREKSFDAVLSVEVLHGLGSDENIVKALENLRTVSRNILIATFPKHTQELCKALREKGFSIYRYILRGFAVFDKNDVHVMYNTNLLKIVKFLLKVFVKIFPRFVDSGYIIAISR